MEKSGRKPDAVAPSGTAKNKKQRTAEPDEQKLGQPGQQDKQITIKTYQQGYYKYYGEYEQYLTDIQAMLTANCSNDPNAAAYCTRFQQKYNEKFLEGSNPTDTYWLILVSLFDNLLAIIDPKRIKTEILDPESEAKIYFWKKPNMDATVEALAELKTKFPIAYLQMYVDTEEYIFVNNENGTKTNRYTPKKETEILEKVSLILTAAGYMDSYLMVGSPTLQMPINDEEQLDEEQLDEEQLDEEQLDEEQLEVVNLVQRVCAPYTTDYFDPRSFMPKHGKHILFSKTCIIAIIDRLLSCPHRNEKKCPRLSTKFFPNRGHIRRFHKDDWEKEFKNIVFGPGASGRPASGRPTIAQRPASARPSLAQRPQTARHGGGLPASSSYVVPIAGLLLATIAAAFIH